MAIGDVGEGLAAGYLLAIDMGGARTVLDVVVALGLITPELTLRFVDQAFHLDVVARHAEGTSYGLSCERQSLLTAQTVELAEVVGGDEVADRASEIL